MKASGTCCIQVAWSGTEEGALLKRTAQYCTTADCYPCALSLLPYHVALNSSLRACQSTWLPAETCQAAGATDVECGVGQGQGQESKQADVTTDQCITLNNRPTKQPTNQRGDVIIVLLATARELLLLLFGFPFFGGEKHFGSV